MSEIFQAFDLHSHLYGALTTEHIQLLGKRKKPRWNIFRDSYLKTRGTDPDLENLFDGSLESLKKLKSYHHFLDAGNFSLFQTAFDLVISVSHLDQEELEIVSGLVLDSQVCKYSEYRMLFPERFGMEGFIQSTKNLSRSMKKASDSYRDKSAKLAIGIHRTDHRGEAYDALYELMEQDEVVREMVVGIDFCAEEKGYPPEEKLEFFERVLQKNRSDPTRALAILYHVGESYDDKSLESAIRWIEQSASGGAHRLGHSVALGEDLNALEGTSSVESSSERILQIDYELKHQDELEDSGYEVDPGSHLREKEMLQKRPSDWRLEAQYDEKRILQLHRFRNFAMQRIRKSGAVIESCPTSNVRIAGLQTLKKHPLGFFLKNQLPVVLGSDDGGILDTDLVREFENALSIPGVEDTDLEGLMDASRIYDSRTISGRKD